MKTVKTGLLAAVIAVCTAMASAAPIDIRVDFNGTAADPAGDWNVMESPENAQANLVDFGTGVGSGVDLVVAGDLADSSASTEWDTSNPGPAWDAAADSGMDYFWLGGYTGEVGTATFSGLTPGQAYRVELIASSDSTTNGDAEYTVNGAFFDGSTDGMYNFLDGYNEGSWLVWSSVTADASGELVVQVDTINGDGRGRMNALQLTPEPASMVLLGLGGLGILRRRRA
jgi:hypothetical protein